MNQHDLKPDSVPDFIIVGAMKCATSTLHDQLAQQAGFFMSDPKEPNYFSDDEIFALGSDWYEKLFANAKDSDIKGESSTHYTKLPTYPLTIQRLKEVCPNPKLIYLMRHPVERLVSHYIHDWTEQKITCDINQAVSDFPILTEYSRYARQIEPFIAQFGADSIKPVFLKAMHASPQAVLESVAAFLGAQQTVKWVSDAGPKNVSSERMKRTPFVNFMLENQWVTVVRQHLVPQKLRDLVKRRYQMQRRPVLDRDIEQALILKFDEDLNLLGQWLGTELTCATFNARTEVLVNNAFVNFRP